MELEFTDAGRYEFLALDKQLRTFFKKHAEKLLAMPPRRHLRGRNPFFVENVTLQARLVYFVEGDKLTVHHCFAAHKDYEAWYTSFK